MKMKRFFFPLLAVLFVHTSAWAGTYQELASQLDSPNPAVRLEALRQIALDYTPESLPLLVKASGDQDEDVRERAVQALGLSGSPRAIETATQALRDPDESVRWRAVQALDCLGARDAVEDLSGLGADNSWRVKVCVYKLLGTISSEISKESPGELPGKKVREQIRRVLLGGLEDPDERVRLAAASTLAVNKDPAALEPLLDLLKNGSMLVRSAAGVSLGDLGDPAAIKPLLDAISDPSNREEADGSDFARWGPVKGLVKITGRDFGCDAAIDAAAREEEGFERRRALNSLNQLKKMDIAGNPAGLLKDKCREVKLKVFELSGTIDDKILEPYLRQGLEDSDVAVRQAAKAALAGN
ncbi:MAG TPA: HEAT repeat domain-containing protein [archaeon]|nr:HEAT repeat domain-containing protein [archaeon]